MARPAPKGFSEEDTIPVPGSVRFPVELIPPDGFDPACIETWPRVEGRLEWVGGRLLYMPPCGALQQGVVADLVTTLGIWVRSHPEFFLGTNEAGMRLGEDTRGADAAVWRRADMGAIEPAFQRTTPVLAAEVAGRDEKEPALRDKAHWYLAARVPVVWILLPEAREVIVVTRTGEGRYRAGDQLPEDPRLPDLAPPVDEFFRQLAAR